MRSTASLRSTSSLSVFAISAALLVVSLGCESGPESDDPHIQPNEGNYEENREFISPPTLLYPIYQCATNVAVQHFLPDARIDVFIDGAPTPVASAIGEYPSLGVNIDVGTAFVAGQVVTATQTKDGATSAPSNAVTVTDYTEDYPDGLPKPRLNAPPLWECGRAAGVSDVVPGSIVEVYAENPDGVGGFDPEVKVGGFNATPEWGLNWTGINPQYELGARIHARASLCGDPSPRSDVEETQPEPSPIDIPTLHDVYEGNDRVIARGPAPAHGPLTTGAVVRVFEAGSEVGITATPGGAGHIIGVNPDVSSADYTANQSLCTEGDRSDPVTPHPCEDLPAPIIAPPAPGDTEITVTTYVEGAEILVFADGVEIGHSGPPVIHLSAPLADGQTLIVLQRLGDCDSDWVYVIDVECENLGGDDRVCSGQWPAFRHNGLRTGNQVATSDLSDPYEVKKLEVGWSFDPPGPRIFRASPIVWGDKVYIGHGSGRFYALDVATGAVQWEFPLPGDPALVSQYESNPSSCGIASSAAIGRIEGEVDAVIFGAPDQSIGAGLGSGRLFALNAQTGAVIWRSDEIAVLDGLTRYEEDELHEQIGYSSPLILGDRVYIGIADHGDNPIQNGRVVAVELDSGNIIGTFSYKSTGTRGGGVWSSVAGGFDREGIFITTGNSNVGDPEPSPNHGLSMLRLNASSGGVEWKLQPVPYALDGDPDWAAGPSLLRATCGDLVVSTMKDGWSYAVEAQATYTPRWQFPPTTSPPDFLFSSLAHGDTRYLFPGAAWDSAYITQTGGKDIINGTSSGFGRLHALNACGGAGGRVRWISTVPSAVQGSSYQIGPPTVSHGIVFVGTRAGHLVALADPSVWPSTSSICSNPEIAVSSCLASGETLVPVPHVLLDLDISEDPIFGEPALAGGRVFVASGWGWESGAATCEGGGSLYMLEPRP